MHTTKRRGLELADSCQVAQWLADGGASLIDVSGGLQGSRGAAYFAPYAQAIKSLVDVPVLVTGGFAEPDLAERAVRE